MRLSVFSPKKSAQLFIDLRKIYHDYLPAEQLTDECLSTLITQADSSLYVTLFNGRHLGAIQITIKKTTAALSLLTVRALTRRRGVATNLLREVEKRLKIDGINNITMDYSEILQGDKEGLILFMQANGYYINQDTSTLQKSLSDEDLTT